MVGRRIPNKAEPKVGKAPARVTGTTRVATPGEPEEAPVVTLARAAVKRYEAERATLHTMKADWDQNFPEAQEAMEEVKQQEDLVGDAIKKAKPLVAESKITIGDFKVQRKWKDPHYDDTEVTTIISQADDWSDTIGRLLDAGIIQNISLDSNAMTAFCARNPDMAEKFKQAWREKEEMTTAVTTPKL